MALYSPWLGDTFGRIILWSQTFHCGYLKSPTMYMYGWNFLENFFAQYYLK